MKVFVGEWESFLKKRGRVELSLKNGVSFFPLSFLLVRGMDVVVVVGVKRGR